VRVRAKAWRLHTDAMSRTWEHRELDDPPRQLSGRSKQQDYKHETNRILQIEWFPHVLTPTLAQNWKLHEILRGELHSSWQQTSKRTAKASSKRERATQGVQSSQ
jgi:hypothetical protein